MTFDASILHSTVNVLVKRPLSVLLVHALFKYLLQPEGAVSSLHFHYELMVHIRPLLSLCSVYPCTFTSMQYDDEVQLKMRQLM